MGRSNAVLAPLSLLFLAGSIVLLFFVILSGTTHTSPIRQTYFLSADTSDISGARPISQWTYFRICGDNNTNCSHAWPDAPIGWAWSKNPTGPHLPEHLIGAYGDGTTSRLYFYLWRFGWAVYLLALLASIAVFFTSFLSLFGRIGAVVAGIASSASLVLISIAAVLMTATFVKMRDQFTAVGREAHIGIYAFGFTWAAWALQLASTVLFFMKACARRERSPSGMEMGGHRVKEEYV